MADCHSSPGHGGLLSHSKMSITTKEKSQISYITTVQICDMYTNVQDLTVWRTGGRGLRYDQILWGVFSCSCADMRSTMNKERYSRLSTASLDTANQLFHYLDTQINKEI